MMTVISSQIVEPIGWADTSRYALDYGVKASTSLVIPRAWTLPFLLFSADNAERLANGMGLEEINDTKVYECLYSLASDSKTLIIKSSVIGESILDRGTYESVPFKLDDEAEVTSQNLITSVQKVLASTSGRRSGLMIQRYIRPFQQGEFGNLNRVSKTRDQWEIATRESDELITKLRVNSPRDRAANPEESLAARAGLPRERLFASIGAWLNNELLLRRS